MIHSFKTLSRDIDKLRDIITIHGKSITLEFEGKTIEINIAYTNALRDRENAYLIKECKGSKKQKTVTVETRCGIVDSLYEKVEYSLKNTNGVKVSPALQKFIRDEVHTNLNVRRECPKKTTFAPRLLFYMDDHFAEFVDGIRVGLLSHNMEGRGSAAIREELTKVEGSFMRFLHDNQVGASTVLNALVVQYINSESLRVGNGERKSQIQMDDRLERFLDAPMNSMFDGGSLSKVYTAKTTTKVVGKKEDGKTVISLAGYRMEHPKKSVRDYLMHVSSKAEQDDIKKGYIKGKHIMSIVSAHLIPASSFSDSKAKALNMDVVDNHYTNANVNTLISIQALLSASTDKNDVSTPRPARSPSRSPKRAASRSPKRAASRSPKRAASPARTPSRSASRSPASRARR